MKKIIFLMFSLLFFNLNLFSARYYVDSSKGDDNNIGKSASSPWKTLNKINNFKFLPGDSILLKRGEVWREQLKPNSGDETGYITYTCYGKISSPKPLILGSVSGNNPIQWKNSGDNIWTIIPVENEITIKADIGNIIFNGGPTCGVKVWNETDLKEQGAYFHDAKNSVVKLYSVENPAKYYKNIELAIKRHIIDEGNKSYARYDNLDLRYGAAHGIGGGSVHHIIISNCDISFIGGSLQQYSANGKPVRYGNGIEFWDNAHDCFVSNCRVGEIYDAALTNQGKDNIQQYNIYYWNNIIWNSEYSFEYWLGKNSKGSNIYFENNTCFNAGKGWGHDQRPDGHNGRHLMFYNNNAKMDNFFIRNNIFSESTESAIRLSKVWVDLDKLILDHNLYFESSGKLIDWQGTSFNSEDFKNYQTTSGKDKSSFIADPLFKDPLKLDFQLRPNSPAIDAGITPGDFHNSSNEVIKFGSQYDIGAIESNGKKTKTKR